MNDPEDSPDATPATARSRPEDPPPSEATPSDPRRPGRGARPGIVLPLTLLLVLVAVLSFALLHDTDKPALPGGAEQSTPGSSYDGTLALPLKPAPAIDLHNYRGRSVSLSEYRGKAVLVTFLYTNCPDVCPLITSNLRVVMNELGSRANRVQVIAVSVDPRGDTDAAVGRFLRAHEMLGRMQYLVGSPSQLARTWTAWSVGSTREVGQPQLVAHSALVYGVDASGRLRTVYPATFAPSQIVHDVPKLAAR
ncbi:MAG TPA: SCO family protein [Solirubrobacteraceae bacterium]|jgi:protein SCO1/2|nr:SCO family protein [Solirubrobacteraceae bacterium]